MTVADTVSHAVPAESVLRSALRSYQRRVRINLAAGMVVGIAGIAFCAILLVVLGDHWWTGGWSLGALVVLRVLWLAGVVGAIAYVVARTFRRRVSALYAAQQLERSAQIRHNSLVNALQLRGAAAERYASDAATRRAAEDVVAHPPEHRPLAEMARWQRTLFAATALAWIVYIALSPKPVWPSVARFLGAPWPAPTATCLTLLRPGSNEVVHIGEPVQLVFALHGRWVDQTRLEIVEESGDVLRRYASVVGPVEDIRRGATFTLPPFETVDDLHFVARAGDGVLRGTIHIYPLPAIADLVITLIPPAYTGHAEEATRTADLDVVAGTTARAAVIANTPMRDPVFVFHGGERESHVRMRRDVQDEHAAGVEFTFVESGEYSITFTDPWGWPVPEPSRHKVTVRSDAPPRVDIVVPRRGYAVDDLVYVSECPELVVSARDDFGLARLQLVTESNGRIARRDIWEGADATQMRLRTSVASTDVGVVPAEPIKLWFEAADGHVALDGRDVSQIGRSRSLTLTVDARPEEAPEEMSAQQPSGTPSGDGDRASGDAARAAGDQGQGESDASSGDAPGSQDDRQVREAPDDTSSDEAPTEDSPAEAADSDSEVQEPGPDDPNAGSDDSPAPKQEGAGGDSQSDEAAPNEEAAGGLEREVEEFEREFGEDIERVVEALGDGAEDDQGAGEAPATSDDADEVDETGADSPGVAPDGERPSDVDAEALGRPAGDAPGEAADQSSDTDATPDGGPEQDSSVDDPPAPADGPTWNDDAANPVESIGRPETVDLLRLAERGIELTEDALVRAGLSPQRAAAFVRAFERLQAVSRLAAEAGSPLVTEANLAAGAAGVSAGTGVALDVRREGAADGGDHVSELQGIAPPAEQEVPADLSALLDAYYRAVAQHDDQ